MDYEEDEDDVAAGEALTGPLSDAFSGLQGNTTPFPLLLPILLHAICLYRDFDLYEHNMQDIAANVIPVFCSSFSCTMSNTRQTAHSSSSAVQVTSRNILDKKSNAHSLGLTRTADPNYSQA